MIFKEKTTIKTAGFSIVEFIVVISIFAIMSGISIINYSEYASRIQEVNIGQDIALTVRQAQLYGLSASNRTVGEEGLAADFFVNTVENITQDTSVRGVAINTDDKHIILFEDVDKNFIYTSADIVIDERYVIANSVSLVGCVIEVGETPDPVTCNVSTVGDTDYVNISFERPYPDAHIEYENSLDGPFTHFLIGIYGKEGIMSNYIQIDPSGQISVRKYEQE